MASGVWPCGLWILAAWRGLILHARSGAPDDQGRMVFNLPGPCPPTCSRPPAVPHVPSPRRVEIAFMAGFVVLSLCWRCRAMSTAASGANATCGHRGFGGAGYGGLSAGPVAVPALTPVPVPHVRERGQTRSAISNNDKKVGLNKSGCPESRGLLRGQGSWPLRSGASCSVGSSSVQGSPGSVWRRSTRWRGGV